MRKKHVQYRSALLIGLLTLTNLSSCLHTNSSLGVSDQEIQSDENSSYHSVHIETSDSSGTSRTLTQMNGVNDTSKNESPANDDPQVSLANGSSKTSLVLQKIIKCRLCGVTVGAIGGAALTLAGVALHNYMNQQLLSCPPCPACNVTEPAWESGAWGS